MEGSGAREAAEVLKGGNGYVIKTVKMSSETVCSVLWDIITQQKKKENADTF